MAPGEELARELEKDAIRRYAEFDAWWGEQWRKNETTERRINSLDEKMGERLTLLEVSMQDLGKFRAEVRVASLLGSVIGSAVMSVIVGFILWKLTGSHP